MEFVNSSSNYFLNKSTYINLRWIGIIGQFLTINIVAFIFKFEFNYILSNVIVIFGAISNIFLIRYNRSTQLSNKISFYYLLADILQLSLLLYLTGGILNPFSVFLIIPSVFASSNLNIKTNLILILIVYLDFIFLNI